MIDWIVKLVRVVQAFANPATAVVSGLLALMPFFLGLGDRLSSIITYVDQISISLTGSVDFTPLAFVNYVFPLSSMLGYLTVYLGLLLLTSTIRMIKAWIPTVS